MKKPLVIVGLAALASLAVVTALASLGWGSVIAFLQAVDRPRPALFADFIAHYYPTANLLLSEGQPTFGYYYPPSFAFWVLPLTWLSPAAALVGWGLIQTFAALALMVLSGLALWREGRGYALSAVALTAASLPLWHSFRWGQVSVPMAALVVAALIVFRRSRWLSPLLLAVATSIKALPLLFVLPWVARRDWRSLSRFAVATGLVMVALPALVLGPRKAWEFTARVRQESAKALATWVPYDANSQYLPYVVARWRRPEAQELAARETPGLRGAGWLLFLATLPVAYRVARRDPDEELLPAGLLFTALPLILPTSWPHYFVCLPLFQVAALSRLSRLEGGAIRLTTLVLVGVSMLLSNLLMFALAGGHPRFMALGLLGVANLLLLIALHLVIWRQGGSRTAPTSPPPPSALPSPGP